MELSDVVYLILMIVFVVFGIFNDSKKKKKKINTSTPPFSPNARGEEDDLEMPPPIPKEKVSQRKMVEHRKRFTQTPDPMQTFESSMNLVTDFEKESSLKGYEFSIKKMDSSSDASGDGMKHPHPILESIIEGDRQAEFQKAIIYSEIINRKY